MISEAQQLELFIHGYRIVITTRDEEGYVVQYPKERAHAVSGWFSREVFVTKELAMKHAWEDHCAVHSGDQESVYA